MPYPNDYVTSHLGKRLIYAELDYNIEDQNISFNQTSTCLLVIIIIHCKYPILPTKLLYYSNIN